MAGLFQWKQFQNIDLNDSFFDSLKEDYVEFPEWFERKAKQKERALIYNDVDGIGAFLYLKNEDEEIELENNTCLPKKPRVKIGTLKLKETLRGQRLGEGAIGVALWHWQSSIMEEVYITAFEKHEKLIGLLLTFGFVLRGRNSRGECVYAKSRKDKDIDYSNPYRSFPFIKPDFSHAGLIPIYDSYHDRLFPYSELKGNATEFEEDVALKGITKIYIGAPQNPVSFSSGDPVFIYRIDTSGGQKTYRSVITSFCTITRITTIKKQGVAIKTLQDYLALAGNKTVFSEIELKKVYDKANLVMFEMVYNGFFGKGNNVNHRTLDDLGLFPCYPYDIKYGTADFKKILELGDVDVSNVIID